MAWHLEGTQALCKDVVMRKTVWVQGAGCSLLEGVQCYGATGWREGLWWGWGWGGFTPPSLCHASRTWPITPNLASRHGKNDSSFQEDGR